MLGDIKPRTSAETVIAMLVQVCGATSYAALIGAWTSVATSRDASSTRFEQKLNLVRHYLSYRSIPAELKRRINSYYDFLWRRERGVDGGEVLSRLPASLRNEILFFRASEILSRVKLFERCEMGFISSIAVCLVPMIIP